MNFYNETEAEYSLRKLNPDNIQLLFRVNGNSGIKIKKILIDSLNINDNQILLYRDTNLNSILDDSDEYICKITNDNSEDISEKLFTGRKIIEAHTQRDSIFLTGNYQLKNAPLKYSYFLVKNTPWKKNIDLQFDAYNLVTGKKVAIKKSKNNIYLKQEADSIHPWKLSLGAKPQTIILKGEIVVKKTQIYNKNQTIIIRPGTVIHLFPKVSLFFYGKVIAKGTKENPIEFLPARNEPWGVIAIQGQKANGSRLVYCKFKGGSEDNKNLVYYSGQVSFHDVKDILIDNCRFEKNYTGDDNLHIAYVTGSIRNSIFIDSNSDALDSDISSVEIKNNIFINSGNDALDFMTTEAVVKNCFFINSGDKGISVGEETNGIFESNLFYGCYIGIEVKDKSVVKLKDTFIVNSKHLGINLYNKNWRYDRGGTINSDKVYIVGKSEPLKSDKKSTVNLDEIIQTLPQDIHLESFWKGNVALINNKDVYSTIDPVIERIKGFLHGS